MEIKIKLKPCDEKIAIEYIREIMKREIAPVLIESKLHPTFYSIKKKNNKPKFHRLFKRKNKK